MSNKPNVVIIMTDQQRADLCKREGYALDTTPFLDTLAQHGIWFNHAYTPMPTCTPARTSLLTGRYPSATRVRTNHNTEDAVYSKDIFDVAKEQGYVTGLCGKNGAYPKRDEFDFFYEAGHLQAEDDETREDYRAFAEFMEATHFHMAKDATPFPVEVQFPYRMVDKAQGWLSTLDKEQNFLLWLSFPEPHNPYQVPEPYYSMFAIEDLPALCSSREDAAAKGFKYQWCRESFTSAFPDFDTDLARARANYMGLLRLLDDQVKRFVSYLEQAGLKENTIIIFMSDHGDFVGEYGLMRKGPELAESLVRIPLSFTGPEIKAEATAHPAFVSIVDVMPTLCEAMGATIPKGVQGRSLWPLLTGQAYPDKEFESAYAEVGFGGLYYNGAETLDPAEDGRHDSPDGETWGDYDELNSWTQSGQVRMVAKGAWKLVFDMNAQGQLYNLVDDPAELVNLYNQVAYQTVQQDLMADLLKWMLRVQDPLPLPRRRYVMKLNENNYRDAFDEFEHV